MKEAIESVAALARAELDKIHSLAPAVLAQLAGDSPAISADEVQNVLDAARHGGDGGFCGFTYSMDCAAFVAVNLDTIRRQVFADAKDTGLNPVAFIRSWRRVKSLDISDAEIIDLLYGQGKDEAGFVDVLSWYALESVGAAVQDYLDNQGG